MNSLYNSFKLLSLLLAFCSACIACGQNNSASTAADTIQNVNEIVVEQPSENPSDTPKKVSILGDSYSTFEGYIPKGFISWYKKVPKKGRPTDVTEVEQTWWDIFLKEHGYVLEKNNSYSGSTICNTGYAGNDYSDRSFISRVDQLGNPDLILVYGGTNDSWAESPLGDFVYENWTKKQLYSFRPAVAFMLSELKRLYPNAEIKVMINGLDITKQEIISSLQEISDHYGIQHIIINDLQKMSVHPDQVGMRQIVEQLDSALNLPHNL